MPEEEMPELEGYEATCCQYPSGRRIWILVPEEEHDEIRSSGQVPLVICEEGDPEEI